MSLDWDISIQLMGRFRVTTKDGTDLTPRSTKGQALIALLATSADCERGRSWVQAKLWSDRGPEQGSRSLRQELSQLRKCFGQHGGFLSANRKSLSLDDDIAKIVDFPEDKECDFLEGLDVRDDEFNHWLSVERSRRSSPSGSFILPKGRRFQVGAPAIDSQSISIVGQSAPSASCKVLEAQFIDAAAKTLRDVADVDVHPVHANSGSKCGLIVGVQVFEVPGRIPNLRTTLERVSDSATLWSETIEVMDSPDGVGLGTPCLQVINQLFEQACIQLSKNNTSAIGEPAALASLALRKSFSIEKQELEIALQLLARAHEMSPRGVYLAWQAQILAIQMVERYDDDLIVLRERGAQLCSEAIRLDPTNSNVLAASANFTTIVERNETGGFELSRLAVRANPANPLAWWSLSNAIQYLGDSQKAYDAARRAYELSMGTRLEFWSAFQRALSAMLNGQKDEAIRFGELSTALQKQFRPPLRYLGALYADVEDSANARRVFDVLETRETDFSLDRLVNDPDYPVKLMRTRGLVDPEKIKKLQN